MDPYKVLGIDANADEETIKKAYRSLVKKYHPDKYVNSPLADLASEKMKEINQAYDMLTNKSGAQNQYSQQNQTGSGYNTYQNEVSFAAVRSFMASFRMQDALAMLEKLPRTAEWYYLSGLIRIHSGWYDQGISFLRTAVQMDPSNQEYRDALGNVENRNRSYRQANTTANSGCCSCDCSDMCCYCSLCSGLTCCC